MPKSQLLREAARQRSQRNTYGNCPKTVQNGYGNSAGSAREVRGVNARIGQFSAKLDQLTESELEMFKAQILKQLDRERRLHKARSYLYSVSRHIQLYTTMKTLEGT